MAVSKRKKPRIHRGFFVNEGYFVKEGYNMLFIQ